MFLRGYLADVMLETKKLNPTHKGILCIEMHVIFMIFLHVALDKGILFQLNSAEGSIANA